MKTTKSIGDYGEKVAARYLLLHGFLPVARNYRSGHYEIDLIAENFRRIVFVEVKTRSYQSKEEIAALPPPSHAVDQEKRAFTRKAAQQYLHEHPTKKKPSMDVIEVFLEKDSKAKKPKVLQVRYIKEAY